MNDLHFSTSFLEPHSYLEEICLLTSKVRDLNVGLGVAATLSV